MTTEEGNKLIAEFMGHKRIEQNIEGFARLKHWNIEPYGWFEDDELLYHSSWDWLMPVVEKIEALNDGRHHFYIVQNESDISFDTKYNEDGTEIDAPSFRQKAETKIMATWKSVVQFIQWYK